MAGKVDIVQIVRNYLQRLSADGHTLSSTDHDLLIRRVVQLLGDRDDIEPRICRAIARALGPNDPDVWLRTVERDLLVRLRTTLARATAS